MKCLYCGKEFDYEKRQANYCSPACKTLYASSIKALTESNVYREIDTATAKKNGCEYCKSSMPTVTAKHLICKLKKCPYEDEIKRHGDYEKYYEDIGEYNIDEDM